MKDSNPRSRGTARPSRNAAAKTAEEKLLEAYEREIASLQRQNAKLLRLVEMVMEERFYRPAVSGVRENLQTSAVPLDALNDVAVFDEREDAAQSRGQEELFRELQRVESEHLDWRAKKGLGDAQGTDAADAA